MILLKYNIFLERKDLKNILYHVLIKLTILGIIGGKLKGYALIGWGLPLLLMGLPFVIFLHDLGRDPRCFISWENEVKLLFFIPQGVLCAIATFCGVVVFTNLTTTALR